MYQHHPTWQRPAAPVRKFMNKKKPWRSLQFPKGLLPSMSKCQTWVQDFEELTKRRRFGFSGASVVHWEKINIGSFFGLFHSSAVGGGVAEEIGKCLKQDRKGTMHLKCSFLCIWLFLNTPLAAIEVYLHSSKSSLWLMWFFSKHDLSEVTNYSILLHLWLF